MKSQHQLPLRKIFLFSALLSLIACKHERKAPDVSNIKVTVHIERFDTAFFALDSNNIVPGLYQLAHEYPYFINDFIGNILGAGPLSDTNRLAFAASYKFLTSYSRVKDSIGLHFRNMEDLEKQLGQAYRYVKYYYPQYSLPPKTVAFIGPFDAPGIAITKYAMAIGLQLYAGSNFSFYNSEQGQQMYPLYISRRFEPVYIVPNAMKAVVEDIYPDKSAGRPLMEQMIEKGKYWWLAQKFLPSADDSLITGFTGKQLQWCKVNEGLIWNYVLESTDMYTIDPDIIKNFIGDAPTTQGMPPGSPGNIGQWVGWQIVNKYASENEQLTPDQLMKTDAKTIFTSAKYKPR